MLASYRGLAARLILDRRSRFYTFNMPKAADDLAAPAFRHPPRQRQGRNSECCLGEGDEGGSIHFARGLELRLAGRHRQDSDMTIIRRGSQAVACPPTHTQNPQFRLAHPADTVLCRGIATFETERCSANRKRRHSGGTRPGRATIRRTLSSWPSHFWSGS